MGYTTKFIGEFSLNKHLPDEIVEKITALQNLNVQEQNSTLAPSSRCQWIVTKDRKHLIWDEVEKFTYYIEWLKYIIEHILGPNGFTLSGEVIAEGEDSLNDVSRIKVVDNNLKVIRFTEKQIQSHLKQKATERYKTAGEIIVRTKGDIRPIYARIYITLKELFKGFFHSVKDFALVQEQNGKYNLYEIISDEKNKIVKNRVLLDPKYALHLQNITEIIDLNFFPYRLFFRTNQTYLICYTSGTLHEKKFINVQDIALIEQLKTICTDISKKSFSFRKGSGLKFSLYLISKIFLFLFFLILSLSYFGLAIIVLVAGTLLSAGLIPIIVIPLMIYLYLKVYQLFYRKFFAVYLKDIV